MKGIQDMKKPIFLLIPLLLTSLISSCALIESDVEQEPEVQEYHYDFQAYQRRLEEEERTKERGGPWRMVWRKGEISVEPRQEPELYETEYAKAIRIKREKVQKEQEAKHKRFKEEWIEFIQSGDGSIKNKTTQEVKKLVDRWEDRWRIRMGIVQENARKIFLEDFSLENFYKIFGKPRKTQYIKNAPVNKEYILWYTCKDGTVLITVGEVAYDDGWVMISDLNIL